MAYINGNEITFGVTLIQGSGGGGGYEQGYSAGYTAGKSDGYTDGHSAGYEQGKIDGNVLFYAKNFPSFVNATFPDGYEMTINMPNFSPINDYEHPRFMNTKGIVKLKLLSSAIIDGLSLTTAFSSSTIKELDLSEFPRNVKSMASTFLHCNYLQKILGELDLTNATFNGYEFHNCYALEEVRVKAGTLYKSMAIAQSDKLSAESVQSIIDGLADLTGGTAQVLTLHADVKAKLTETQLATITQKNWSVA